MASAVGSYVTPATAELRLLQSGTTVDPNDVPLISMLCNEVNSTIESKTSRVLAPIPPFDTTFSGTAGDRTITLATATGLNVGDDLLLGPLSGTHEGNSIMSIDLDTSLTTPTWEDTHAYALNFVVQPTTPNGHAYICVIAGDSDDTVEPIWPTDGSAIIDNTVVWLDQGAIFSGTAWLDAPLDNSYANAVCQRIYIQDGHDAIDGRVLVVSRGIINLAALEIAPYSGGPFAVASQRDYFLRPSEPDTEPGWPFTEIIWTDVPTGTPYPVFYPGYANVRLIGPGPCVDSQMPSVSSFGWPAIPDDVRKIAETLFLAYFRERASSGGDSMTVNLDGSRVYERALSYEDKRTIERYRQKAFKAV